LITGYWYREYDKSISEASQDNMGQLTHFFYLYYNNVMCDTLVPFLLARASHKLLCSAETAACGGHRRRREAAYAAGRGLPRMLLLSFQGEVEQTYGFF
jgi:hypothetical protein